MRLDHLDVANNPIHSEEVKLILEGKNIGKSHEYWKGTMWDAAAGAHAKSEEMCKQIVGDGRTTNSGKWDYENMWQDQCHGENFEIASILEKYWTAACDVSWLLR